MASSKALPFVAMLLVVLPMVAMADVDGNWTAFYDRLCKEVDCGKGKCVGNNSYPLSFECQCEPGWKQTQYDDDVDDDHRFLPCVIPNCTLNYGSCQPAPPPVPEKEAPNNSSFFDRTLGSDCADIIKVAKSTSGGTGTGAGTPGNPGEMYFQVLNSGGRTCHSDHHAARKVPMDDYIAHLYARSSEVRREIDGGGSWLASISV
ncbi:unnamed protein product [Dovyalis caffra]|uniref:EGF-like domain-containing protein n=1 Tax=Dovyalis caffra TaxID=77055 RepID=A0AAV1RW64_9ROSI|nr:unnamed protein product [Dovyalis caffra]